MKHQENDTALQVSALDLSGIQILESYLEYSTGHAPVPVPVPSPVPAPVPVPVLALALALVVVAVV